MRACLCVSLSVCLSVSDPHFRPTPHDDEPLQAGGGERADLAHKCRARCAYCSARAGGCVQGRSCCGHKGPNAVKAGASLRSSSNRVTTAPRVGVAGPRVSARGRLQCAVPVCLRGCVLGLVQPLCGVTFRMPCSCLVLRRVVQVRPRDSASVREWGLLAGGREWRRSRSWRRGWKGC